MAGAESQRQAVYHSCSCRFLNEVHRTSLDFARAAVYGPDSLSELSRERIERYFVKVGQY